MDNRTSDLDRHFFWRHRYAVVGGTLLAALITSTSASAANYRWGGYDIAFDTTLSAGVTVRTQDADSDSPSLGNSNFDESGDVVSTLFKATHDLDIRKGKTGFFTRFTYYYDPLVYEDDDIPGDARKQAALDADLLDAFVYSRGEIGDIDVYGRLGSQVVSWGESTFFGLGINTFNPFDVSKSRAPGAEIKELLVPVPVVLVGADLTDTLSVEAFAQLKYEYTELDPVGTFFSTSDAFGEGAEQLVLSADAAIPYIGENEADDFGAFGISARYLAESLNYSQFGFYYINYHAVTPYLNLLPATTPGDPSTARYFADYPEDINLVGVSFNAPLGTWSMQGEYSYRDNLPIGLNAADFLPVFLAGGRTDTYERFGYSQAQITGTKVIPPNVIPSVDQMSLVIEVGYGKVHGHTSEAELAGVTDDAYGFRVLLGPQWDNLFRVPGIGAFNLLGTLDYGYSIEGVSPAGGAFNEGAHTLGTSLEANYQNKLSFTLGYTAFFGADDPNNTSDGWNPSHDRDFVQLSAKYSF